MAEAFSEFIATASRMESSYRQLQAEMSRLRCELEERNAELNESLTENQQIRASLQQILDTSPCGVLVVDENDGGIVLINPQACQMLNVQPGGRLCAEDLPPSVYAALTIADDDQEIAIDTVGGKRWLSVRGSRANNRPATQLSGGQTVLIIRDISAQKQAEAQREASRNLVALGEMAGILAHEIRNPLASMELLTGLLASQPALENEPQEWIKHLQAGVRTLAATVSNVLQLHTSRCTKQTAIQLSSFLESAINFVRPLAEQAGVGLTLVENVENATILADPNALQQVVLNLAINAFRHTPPGGTLTVSATLRPQTSGPIVRIEFADSGTGILADHLPHIFEAGFSTTGQSPGLGLTICQRLVQQHGGSLRVQSEAGRGATFILELPRA